MDILRWTRNDRVGIAMGEPSLCGSRRDNGQPRRTTSAPNSASPHETRPRRAIAGTGIALRCSLCGSQHGRKPAGLREQLGSTSGHVAFLERGDVFGGLCVFAFGDGLDSERLPHAILRWTRNDRVGIAMGEPSLCGSRWDNGQPRRTTSARFPLPRHETRPRRAAAGTGIALRKPRAGWAEAQPSREDQDHELTIRIIGGLPEWARITVRKLPSPSGRPR